MLRIIYHQYDKLLGQGVISVFAFCFILKRIILGWKLPEVPTWTIRVITINFVQLAIVTLIVYNGKSGCHQLAYFICLFHIF